MPTESNNADSEPLASKIGVGSTVTIIDVLSNSDLEDGKKKGILISIFGLSPEEADKLLNPKE